MSTPPTSPLSPVVLFAFNRPDHLKRTLDALRANPLAGDTELFVYSDAARSQEDAGAVQAVRNIVREQDGFKSVHLIERQVNHGLARNIIEGVTAICERFGRVIVLEDDLVTSPHFLKFMNEALDLYEDDERVASVHGYVYPVSSPLPENFFLRGSDCWGWATWRRAWRLFNPDGTALYNALISKKLEAGFNFGHNYDYMKMLQDQILGRNNSWAIRWYASTYLQDKLTLYPGRSLVHNIGIDGSGTHCGETNSYDVHLSDTPIPLTQPAVEDDARARALFAAFLGESNRISTKRQCKAWVKYTKQRLSTHIRTQGALLKFKVLQARNIPRLEGPYANWRESELRSSDPSTPSARKEAVADIRLARTQKTSLVHGDIEYAWPLLAGLLMVAAENEQSLKVLDFGGSLGSSYFQNKKFLARLKAVQWGVVEQADFVKRGQAAIAEDGLTFFDTISTCQSAIQPNVALFSSVLQYLPDPFAVLDQLEATSVRTLIIDRTPFSNAMEDQYFVQQVPDTIYRASYPIRVFSRRLFELKLAERWMKLESFASLDNIPSLIQATWEGRIYVRK